MQSSRYPHLVAGPMIRTGVCACASAVPSSRIVLHGVQWGGMRPCAHGHGGPVCVCVCVYAGHAAQHPAERLAHPCEHRPNARRGAGAAGRGQRHGARTGAPRQTLVRGVRDALQHSRTDTEGAHGGQLRARLLHPRRGHPGGGSAQHGQRARVPHPQRAATRATLHQLVPGGARGHGAGGRAGGAGGGGVAPRDHRQAVIPAQQHRTKGEGDGRAVRVWLGSVWIRTSGGPRLAQPIRDGGGAQATWRFRCYDASGLCAGCDRCGTMPLCCL